MTTQTFVRCKVLANRCNQWRWKSVGGSSSALYKCEWTVWKGKSSGNVWKYR